MLTFAVSFVSLNSIFVTAWKVGVARGDCFTYEMFAFYSSSNSEAEIDVSRFESNNTNWVRIQITGVKGTLIFHIYTLQFKDGTQTEIAGQTEVAANSWSQSGVSFRGVPIFPAELAAGDSVPSLTLTVNETLDLAYVGESGQTNQFVWNSTFDSEAAASTSRLECLWSYVGTTYT